MHKYSILTPLKSSIFTEITTNRDTWKTHAACLFILNQTPVCFNQFILMSRLIHYGYSIDLLE